MIEYPGLLLPPECHYLGRDPYERGYWIQYGDNREAKKFIADRDVVTRHPVELYEELTEWAYSVYAYMHPEILAYEVES